jgi:calumenin
LSLEYSNYQESHNFFLFSYSQEISRIFKIKKKEQKIMKHCQLLILTGLINLVLCGVPKNEEKRVLDHDFSQHLTEEHDRNYDHEQFLGEDAKTFDQLPPEESRRRLGVIVDKIDSNNDNFVDLSELKAWISYTQRRYIDDDVDRQWKSHNPDNNATIAWDTYRKNVYGFMDDMDPADLDKEENSFSYKSMLTRDRRRWNVADKDADDALTREEFTDFLHPEESKHMRDVVVAETIEDIDKDNDGKVSVEEVRREFI